MRDGWVQTPIGDVAQVLSGFAFKSELFNKSEGIPLIRIRDLPKRESTEALYSGSYDDRYVVKRGDFLIGMDGEFHCYEWNGPDALLNQRVCRIQDFKIGRVVPRYIYFAVNQYLDKIEQDTGYTTVKHISAKQVLAITIPLPPLSEQKRIVDLISSVDSYIEALQQQLESAKRSWNALLHELLTAGGKDWVETTLGDLATWSSGKSISNDSRVLDGEFAIIGANGEIGRTNQFLHDQPLIVVGRVGSCGETYLINEKVWISDNALIALPNTKIDITYLYYLLKTFDYTKIISGTTQPLITQGKLKTQLVLLPPLSEQKRIVTIISELDNSIHSSETLLNKTKTLRSGLLSDLLSGTHEIPASYDKVVGAA